MTKIRFYSFIRISMPGLFPCLCGAISKSFSAIGPSDAGINLVGSTFNIQNSIPHKSQKPKAMAEINRPIEFQRGTVGATESAKEGARVLAEGSDIGLGARCREFESPISDQQKQVVSLKTTCFCNFLPHLPPNHYLPSALTANKNLPDHLSQEDSFFITANMALISSPASPPPSHSVSSPYFLPVRFVWRGSRTP